jgi:maleate isomerase
MRTEPKSPHKIDVFVPPMNPAVALELREIFPADIELEILRFPVHEGIDLQDRLAIYVEDAITMAGIIREKNCTALIVACTGSSYPLGLSGDEVWRSELQEISQLPVVTSAGAVLHVLRKRNRARIRLLSPYPKVLTDSCALYWKTAGFEVVQEDSLDKTGQIYDVSIGEIRSAIKVGLSNLSQDEVLLIAGTGIKTLQPLGELRIGNDDLFITSQLASVFSIYEAMGLGSEMAASPSEVARSFYTSVTSHG